jgi:hypothetical protein
VIFRTTDRQGDVTDVESEGTFITSVLVLILFFGCESLNGRKGKILSCKFQLAVCMKNYPFIRKIGGFTGLFEIEAL